ncbi:hypothetical protein HMI54_002544 [Coelomomyces lativittatus]|nr:hypothetical protein HMI54_002544 [Coelomomyces lativittatus]KAJ1511939.1 hypothetical protein HMI56_004735 [Coelomomyces lativittatus]KAJ1518038.1 hypothetical protein HMI55_003688 [Coelomomyces lativittatus]
MTATDLKSRIVTHSGTFHADEVLACYMLKCLPEYKSSEIIRSRDQDVWKTATILIDVGAVYDAKTLKFDHHQREFKDTFSEKFFTRLSSAGLIYKHFGKEVIRALLPQTNFSQEQLTLLHNVIYKDLIEAFDAIDNGIEMFPAETPLAYQNHTNLSSIVARLNPMDHETVDVMTCFEKAMDICGSHFMRTVEYYGLAWFPARGFIEQALSMCPIPRVLLLEKHAPWKEHLFTMEASKGLQNDKSILYVVFPDIDGSWRIQCVPKSQGTFENRKSLPSSWCGMRDEKLDAVTGVKGGVFVHASGFIGGHRTKEGALQLAKLALQSS